jgi:hypothetical protein
MSNQEKPNDERMATPVWRSRRRSRQRKRDRKRRFSSFVIRISVVIEHFVIRHLSLRISSFVIGLFVSVFVVSELAADWPTHRGNVARTGCADGQPGPRAANVLWVHKSNDHYIAPPVVAGEHWERLIRRPFRR